MRKMYNGDFIQNYQLANAAMTANSQKDFDQINITKQI